jgi:hypothetical protein
MFMRHSMLTYFVPSKLVTGVGPFKCHGIVERGEKKFNSKNVILKQSFKERSNFFG